MKKELSYFKIEESYGGNQNWFTDPMMKMGGCAAVTACDLCIYLKYLKRKNHLYPYDIGLLTKKDYINFSKIMKPYLRPRMNGINTLKLFIDGFNKYLFDVKEYNLQMTPFSGNETVDKAIEKIKYQIDNEIPIPYLLLKHENTALNDFIWHWFLVVGYDEDDDFKIKVVTYGQYFTFSLRELWNTGYEEKGGMIIIEKIND